eukprot:scaffold14961_cov33-Attheya_sp.AAC.1
MKESRNFCLVVASALLFYQVRAFALISSSSRTRRSSIIGERIALLDAATRWRSTPRLKNHGDEEIDLSSIPDVEITEEEKIFFARTKQLCEERNLHLEKVKNARDLNSVKNSPIKAGRLIRLGRVSDASEVDIQTLFQELGVKTLVDLRSPTELKDDPTLENPKVFDNFTSFVWSERDNHVCELAPGEPRIKVKQEHIPGSRRKKARELVMGILDVKNSGKLRQVVKDDEVVEFELIHDEEDEELSAVDDSCCGPISTLKPNADRKERHFVSLMNELKYVRGTLSKLRMRDIAKVLIKSPGAIVSSRVRDECKDVFLDEINEGGLPMLNELLLRFGAPGIRYVLELIADKSRHPVAFYCTAGKDRTGMIAAIVLSLLGVPDEDVVEDYSLSANVYAEMNDHKAMVGALSQRNLNPKTFLGAPPEVMRDTLTNIRSQYGSVEGYLDWMGFDESKREQLKSALTE